MRRTYVRTLQTPSKVSSWSTLDVARVDRGSRARPALQFHRLLVVRVDGCEQHRARGEIQRCFAHGRGWRSIRRFDLGRSDLVAGTAIFFVARAPGWIRGRCRGQGGLWLAGLLFLGRTAL